MPAEPPRPDVRDEPRTVAQDRVAHDLLQLMDGLDRKVREPLRLIYFEGLTQTEAAAALGVSRRAVRRSVARGMHELAGRIIRAAANAEQTDE